MKNSEVCDQSFKYWENAHFKQNHLFPLAKHLHYALATLQGIDTYFPLRNKTSMHKCLKESL